jgi:uncharacterized protein HemX
MAQRDPSPPRSWDTRTLAWSCIGSLLLGALLLYGAGFYWLGQWQTGEQTQKRQAVAACVQDFLLQPDRGLIYVKLKETTSSYQRRQLIRDRKLAATFEIAEQCGDHIRSFDPASFEAPKEANAEQQTPA